MWLRLYNNIVCFGYVIACYDFVAFFLPLYLAKQSVQWDIVLNEYSFHIVWILIRYLFNTEP